MNTNIKSNSTSDVYSSTKLLVKKVPRSRINTITSIRIIWWVSQIIY